MIISFMGWCLILVLTAFRHSYSEPTRVGPVSIELIAKQSSIRPGETIDVGLYFVPDKDWHVYWVNPGDAGMPPKLTWSLPEGFTAGDIKWPAPTRIDMYPLSSYGYIGDILYPVTMQTPETLSGGDSITMEVFAEWLVCKEKCLPGEANLSLTLPVVQTTQVPDSRWGDLFERTYAEIPKPLPDSWQLAATLSSSPITLDIDVGASRLSDPEFEFYPLEKGTIDHGAEQQTTGEDSLFRLGMVRSPYSLDDPVQLSGVLKVASPELEAAYLVEAPFDSGVDDTSPVSAASDSNLPLILLFAFIGGVILNLMPCVLPVLSIKVLNLVQHASDSRRANVSHGLVFTLGVLVSFWVVVGIMLLLKAGGQQLGWGFQLQSPAFVTVLAGFLFLFALNLFGVFELNVGSGTAGRIGHVSSSGRVSGFLSGVLATILATPCSAPFMGAALGFAMTQPVYVSLPVYTCLGLGMASPYLILTMFPALLRFVPKPGRWMESLKQFLGFLLAATVIWLGWILANQSGPNALIVLLLMLLLVSLAAWIYGRWGSLSSAVFTRWLSRAVATVLVAFGIVGGVVALDAVSYEPGRPAHQEQGGLDWRTFSTAEFDQLRRNGRPVFIDFTAAWCLSCQVNERVALSSEKVRNKFKDLNITALKADWTNRSEEITHALASYGRNSVPLYVLYGSEPSDDPIILPEILTPGIVLEALEKIDKS